MRTFVIRALCLLHLSIVAHAEPPNDSLKYDELCAYDSDCTRLKNQDGSYKKPKAGVLEMIRALSQPIKEISKSLGVDPVAVAGSILAENSVNVQVDGDTRSFIEKVKMNTAANNISLALRGVSFSQGFGQIKAETAENIEAFLAKSESRPVRSFDEIKQALLNPIENIKYAGAIVRECQDAYGKYGFDVTKKPALLATLYNLGKCPAKAAATRAAKRTPRENFFGFFVNHYQEDIEKALDVKETGVNKAIAAAAGPKSLNRRLKNDVSLVNFPPKCDADGAGQLGEYRKVFTHNSSPNSQMGRGEYTVVSPGIDCDLKDWSLIRTAQGQTGWISNENLELHSEDFVKSGAPQCDPRIAAACLEKIKSRLGKDALGMDETGLMEVRLVGGRKNPDQPNFKTFNENFCFATDSQGRSSFQTAIEANQVEDYIRRMDKMKPEIIAGLRLTGWDDPKNLYAKPFENLRSSMDSACRPACKVSVESMEQILSSVPTDYSGYAGYKAFNALPFSMTNFQASPARSEFKEIADQWDGLLVSTSRECQSFMPPGSSARANFEKVVSLVDTGRKNGLPIIKLANYQTLDVPAICRGLKSAVKTKAAQGAEASIKLKSDECPQCKFNAWGSNGNTYIEFDSSVNYLKEPAEYSEFLATALKTLSQNLGEDPYGSDRVCTYDPMATEKRIEALSSDSCVENIFAPDPYLVNKFSGRPGGAFYKPFASDDRFSIKLKDGCSRSTTADAKGGTTGATR